MCAVYQYGCCQCSRIWDVQKSMSRIDEDETCECGGVGHKDYINSIRRTVIGVPKAEVAEYPYVGKRR